MLNKRIVITGIGVVSPIGIGKDSYWESLWEGKSGIKPITLFDVARYRVKSAGEINDFDPAGILGKRGLLDLDRATKLLLCSAKLALDDAKLEINQENSSRTGVSVGTTLGSLSSISRFNRESILEGPKFANPSVFPNTVVNSPASRVGIKYKITGFNSTISTGMCSSLDAMEFACDFIDFERVDQVLVGSVEDLSIQKYLGATKLKVLSGLNEGHEAISSPYDKRRDGIVLGEGAVMFIIEEYESALKRKANIYAEIYGMASTFDPGRFYKYNYSGNGMARAMNSALCSSKLEPQEIDCIYSNANSTLDADKIEAKAIKEVFGSRAKIIYAASIKSNLGETYSASGGFSLAAALGSLDQDIVPHLINYKEADEECDLNFILERRRITRKINNVMINAFSPNGASSVLIIGRVKSDPEFKL